MSLVVTKPAFCICENKDADQLRGKREADQRLCFRYLDSTIPLLPKSEISSLKSSSVAVQLGLCRTWSETPKTGFLTTRLILCKTCLSGHLYQASNLITLTFLCNILQFFPSENLKMFDIFLLLFSLKKLIVGTR